MHGGLREIYKRRTNFKNIEEQVRIYRSLIWLIILNPETDNHNRAQFPHFRWLASAPSAGVRSSPAAVCYDTIDFIIAAQNPHQHILQHIHTIFQSHRKMFMIPVSHPAQTSQASQRRKHSDAEGKSSNNEWQCSRGSSWYRKCWWIQRWFRNPVQKLSWVMIECMR